MVNFPPEFIKCLVISTVCAVAGVSIALAVSQVPESYIRPTNTAGKVTQDRSAQIAAGVAGATALLLVGSVYLSSR